MPVWKYRSVEEMPPPAGSPRGGPAHLRRWAALWARATRIAGARFAPGVFRYRGVDDPQRSR